MCACDKAACKIPCRRKCADGNDRDTRFGGLTQECGIHVTGDGDGI